MSVCLSNTGLFLLPVQEELRYTPSISDLISEDFILLPHSLTHIFSDTHFPPILFLFLHLIFSYIPHSLDFTNSQVHGRHTYPNPAPAASAELRSFHNLIYIREVVFQEVSLKPL